MTRLYLTRHGQTEWNIENRVQGSKDSPLTQKGIEQALQLGKRLEHTNIDKVYSSSSKRALDTAKLITGDKNIPIIKVREITEMNLGIWEGLKFDEIEDMYSDQYNKFWNTPHLLKYFPGETFECFNERVVKAIDYIAKENDGKDILVVTHGIVLKFIMAYFKNIPLKNVFDAPIIQSTSLSVVEANNNVYEIIKYADIEHYSLKVG